jgi:hypothetical protein
MQENAAMAGHRDGAQTVCETAKLRTIIPHRWRRVTPQDAGDRGNNAILKKHTRDRYKRVARMLGYALVGANPGDWHTLSVVLSVRLTPKERIALAWAGPRSLCASLHLRLGGQGLPPGPDGGAGGVHPRADQGHAGGEEGARRLPRGHAVEHTELARAPGRPQGPRPRRPTRNGRRRRRAWVLEGAR